MRSLKTGFFSYALFSLSYAYCRLRMLSAADISLHGFLQGNYSADTASSNPDGGDFKLAEERLQLKLDASKDPFHIFVKADGWYDHIGQKWDSELREGYIGLHGKQVGRAARKAGHHLGRRRPCIYQRRIPEGLRGVFFRKTSWNI